MRGLLAISVAMLVWGNLAVASLGPAGADDQGLQNISSWTAQLNSYDSTLKLSVACSLSKSGSVAAVQRELQLLRAEMNKEIQLPAQSLTTLACTRPECGGGGMGPCKTCAHPEPNDQDGTL